MKANGKGLDLEGTGAAYLRVSDDQQDTLRQYEAIHAFERLHSVTIPKPNWFKDEGWARDTADRRPDFLRLMKLAEIGRVQWIIVSERDRFGTTDADEFIHFRYQLRKWGCRLYDATGTDWTRKDIATVITAVVDGEKSEQEQHSISKRALGGKVPLARAGEWQGGPVRLGFDVGCFHRETNAELWRVVIEGLHKRRKVYPDGREERFDGQDNFPKYQPVTEVLRLGPSMVKARIDAAVSVFKRFATESISPTALAHYLHVLGFRTAYGGPFQGHHVRSMLQDPTYLGYYTYNKRHFGKFHRFKDNQVVLELNYDERQSANDKADWVQSHRLFEPLVDRSTWDAVQKKLDGPRRETAPRSAALYLSGLVYCAHCGSKMIAGRGRSLKRRGDRVGSLRFEFICGGYHQAIRNKERRQSTCLRNGVFQHELEPYIERWLDETGQRLNRLSAGSDTAEIDIDNLTEPKEKELFCRHHAFVGRLMELLDYIRDNDPDGWAEMWEPVPESQDVPIARAVEFYRRCFDPERVSERLAELEAEHDNLTQQCLKLTTTRAIAKVNKQLADLETEIKHLEQQRQNMADIVEAEWQEIRDLSQAVADAKRAMQNKDGERAMRQKAEALRAIIQRIECTFEATGQAGGGHGKKNARFAKVTIYPVVGDACHFRVDSDNLLRATRATSHM